MDGRQGGRPYAKRWLVRNTLKIEEVVEATSAAEALGKSHVVQQDRPTLKAKRLHEPVVEEL